MANTLTGNIWYVDTAYSGASDDLTMNVIMAGAVVTATAANGRLVLIDPKTLAVKFDLRVATSGESQHFDFSFAPCACPNGLRALTLTNAVASIIGTKGGTT